MKYFYLAAALALLVAAAPASADSPTAAAPTVGTSIGQTLPPFSAELLDAEGKVAGKPFESQKISRPTAFLFLGTQCPVSRAYGERIAALDKKYQERGVEFIYIYSNRDESRATKVTFQKENGFKGPLVDDQGARLALLFGARRTAEIFLTDKRGVLVYHGAVDDSRDPAKVAQPYLTLALDETLAGKPVRMPLSTVAACGIHF